MLTLVVVLALVGAGAATRAFPMESENFAVDLFKTVNPGIEWDITNFLVDLSGRKTTCDYVGHRGPFTVPEVTDDYERIGGLRDTAKGGRSDSDSVNAYIRDTLSSWVHDGRFITQLRAAKKFGCSVRPACRGDYAVISCLFSPGADGEVIRPPTTPDPREPEGDIKALAFTPQQYLVTEMVTGERWDTSHELENLSGWETDCSMVSGKSHTFPHALAKAMASGYGVQGVYAVAENRGETEPALIQALKGMAPTFSKFPGHQVGCSVIPDCMVDGRMWVVASCLIAM